MTLTQPLLSTTFSSEPLPESLKREMKEMGTWNPSCPVSLERLRLLTFTHIDFEGKEKVGEIVVLHAVANSTLEIFKELYEKHFPIAKARRIDHYKGDDEASMIDNNSVSFNCRKITGGGALSLHAYGVAIDINPLQNPYISLKEGRKKDSGTIHPKGGSAFLNRTNQRPGMVEDIVDLFSHHGFSIWGGRWNTPVDWMHFQPARAAAQMLAAMSPEDALLFFEVYTKNPYLFNKVDAKQNVFVSVYQKDPKKFMEILHLTPSFMELEPEKAFAKFLP